MPVERNNLFLWSAIGGAVGIYLIQQQRRKQKKDKHAVPNGLLNSPFSKEMQAAVQLALQAGSNMIAYCDEKGTERESNHDLDISHKGKPEDFCTKVDVENERLVTDGLMEHFPSYNVIGEEATGTGAIPRLTNEPTWIIDPIDGTTNFAAGLPLTCVSIGLCLSGKPVLGVVYAPMTDELYLAVRGFGAYRNGVKITQRQSKKLAESVVCYEFGYARDKDAISRMVGALQRILEHGCRAVRTIGSGVLDMCYVATSRLDVVYAGVASEGWKPWDYCAGLVVAKEAGCAVQPIQQTGDDEFDIYSRSIICAVSPSLLKEVRSALK